MRLDGIPLWDGTEPRGPVELQWEPDRITGLRPAEQRHDDLCVIPGLVDTHVHLIGDAGEGRSDFSTWPLVTTRDEQVLHGVAHAQRALRHGVTTLRDMAGDEAQVALARAFDAGLLPGPRIRVLGMVGMTAGHGDLFVPAAHPLRKPTADGPDECRKLVRTWARAGLHGIKITTSGGVLSVGDRHAWRNYTRAEVGAIVDEAHALGMPVAAHAHSEDGIRVAVEEGVDSIEHGTLMSADLAETLAARGTPVAPTLLISRVIAEGRVPVPPDVMVKAAELVAQRDKLFAEAARAGVRFVLGTDANGFHVRFGDQCAEVVYMAEVLGLDAPSALRAATSDAADAIGMPVGRIAPGLGADFIVLRGRPWERIEDLSVANIVAVVSRGHLAAGNLP
ncbi:amidohydrolase family protein [Nonomuraea glycinis]|uniref:Hydrolase n=1 Tax=Nonomuraea glycinis TaxID=2047744 RepID=A0A917ZZG8_9ACTN|nr:amidohydrolase family protein [Nonomuraea glycinis]MCA2175148.1 amidohydrolase family protein [Nonomuraea glycinis]WSG68618.1 amidohydrolase family protein [Nonomuraea glycinis]GGP00740.1 hydrolase [Nonomuraea glycinis]